MSSDDRCAHLFMVAEALGGLYRRLLRAERKKYRQSLAPRVDMRSHECYALPIEIEAAKPLYQEYIKRMVRIAFHINDPPEITPVGRDHEDERGIIREDAIGRFYAILENKSPPRGNNPGAIFNDERKRLFLELIQQAYQM